MSFLRENLAVRASAGAWPRALAFLGLLPALGIAFASLPLFATGYWYYAEPLVIALHGAGALAALCIGLLAAFGVLPSRPALMLALPSLLLALWISVSGALNGSLMAALYGAPETGFGALWYVDLAALLLLACRLRGDRFTWALIAWAAILAAAAIVLLKLYALLEGGVVLIPVSSFYGWIALMLPVIAAADCAQERRGAWRWEGLARLAAALLASLGLAAISGAITFGLMLVPVLLAALLLALPEARRFIWIGRLPLWLLLLLPLGAALAPLAITVAPEWVKAYPSLWSRHLVQVTLLQDLQGDPLAWSIGRGWGITTDRIAAQIGQSGATLWDVLSSDLLWRIFVHAHNWVIEAMSGGGIVAVLLSLAVTLMPVLLAPPERRLAAALFSMAYLLSLGLWYERAFLPPFLALAFTAFLRDGDQPAFTPPAAILKPLFAGMAALGALGLAYAAHLSLQSARATAPLANFELEPPPDALRLAMPPQGRALYAAELVENTTRALLQGAPAVPTATDENRLRLLLAALADFRAVNRSPALAINAVKLLDEVMLREDMSSLRGALGRNLGAEWQAWIDQSLLLAPRRDDIALGRLNFLLQTGRLDETLLLARRLRLADPESPVGLFYEGSALLLSAPGRREEALSLLRRSLSAGVGRFIPLPPDFAGKLGMGG